MKKYKTKIQIICWFVGIKNQQKYRKKQYKYKIVINTVGITNKKKNVHKNNKNGLLMSLWFTI